MSEMRFSPGQCSMASLLLYGILTALPRQIQLKIRGIFRQIERHGVEDAVNGFHVDVATEVDHDDAEEAVKVDSLVVHTVCSGNHFQQFWEGMAFREKFFKNYEK